MNVSKNKYHIVDEPNYGSHHKLIVNPIVILMVSVFLPLLWSPPFMGKFWMPFVWLVFNSYLLGSPTFWKECAVSFCACLMIPLGFLFAIITINSGVEIESVRPYLFLGLQTMLFLFLYFVVFMQMKPYSIYEYIEQGSKQ